LEQNIDRKIKWQRNPPRKDKIGMGVKTDSKLNGNGVTGKRKNQMDRRNVWKRKQARKYMVG
jgi:hypothetical protein